MNKSVKAALLSALIFPGLGQLSIGYKKRGWMFITLNSVFLYLIISNLMQHANSMINKLHASGAIVNMENISAATSGLLGFSDNSYLNTLLVLLIISWFISIIDAYRLDEK